MINQGLDQIVFIRRSGSGSGVVGGWSLIFGGGAGVAQKRESPDFTFPEVGISLKEESVLSPPFLPFSPSSCHPC